MFFANIFNQILNFTLYILMLFNLNFLYSFVYLIQTFLLKSNLYYRPANRKLLCNFQPSAERHLARAFGFAKSPRSPAGSFCCSKFQSPSQLLFSYSFKPLIFPSLSIPLIIFIFLTLNF